MPIQCAWSVDEMPNAVAMKKSVRGRMNLLPSTDLLSEPIPTRVKTPGRRSRSDLSFITRDPLFITGNSDVAHVRAAVRVGGVAFHHISIGRPVMAAEHGRHAGSRHPRALARRSDL